MNTLIPASAIELEGPWTHRHVSAGGATFHVADMGEGMDHALVLLHGFPEHWWSWRQVLPLLAKQTPRVFALDLRGFGTSDLTRGDCDLTQMALDVIGVVRALGVASFPSPAWAWAEPSHGWSGLSHRLSFARWPFCLPHTLSVPNLSLPASLGRAVVSCVVASPYQRAGSMLCAPDRS